MALTIPTLLRTLTHGLCKHIPCRTLLTMAARCEFCYLMYFWSQVIATPVSAIPKHPTRCLSGDHRYSDLGTPAYCGTVHHAPGV